MEHIDTINKRLRDFYGVQIDNNNAKFRIVWSDEQFETRFGIFDNVSKAGIFLGTYEGYKFVRKYPYLPEQWVLERLVNVPPGTDLIVKQSYEPIWGFGKNDPRECWDAVKILIDTVLENVFRGKESKLPKYKESPDTWNTKEATRERVAKLRKVLFEEDNTPLADSLHFGEGIAVPNKKFTKESELTLTDKE